MSTIECIIQGCTLPHMARGWCTKHYARWLRHGDPTVCKNILGNLELRFWPRVIRSEKGCWLWEGARDPNGYGVLSKGHNKLTRAHRVAWELTHGPIPKDQVICHRCDNPPCCNPAHLFLGTQAMNMEDMSRKGRSGAHRHPEIILRGEKHHRAVLTEVQVVNIRNQFLQGDITQTELARQYSVSQSTIFVIVRRRLWKHI